MSRRQSAGHGPSAGEAAQSVHCGAQQLPRHSLFELLVQAHDLEGGQRVHQADAHATNARAALQGRAAGRRRCGGYPQAQLPKHHGAAAAGAAARQVHIHGDLPSDGTFTTVPVKKGFRQHPPSLGTAAPTMMSVLAVLDLGWISSAPHAKALYPAHACSMPCRTACARYHATRCSHHERSSQYDSHARSVGGRSDTSALLPTVICTSSTPWNIQVQKTSQAAAAEISKTCRQAAGSSTGASQPAAAAAAAGAGAGKGVQPCTTVATPSGDCRQHWVHALCGIRLPPARAASDRTLVGRRCGLLNAAMSISTSSTAPPAADPASGAAVSLARQLSKAVATGL